MQTCFTASVRFYSTYSELIPAPRGFETASAPLDSKKWQHFPANFPSNLTFSVDGDGACHVNVIWNMRTMETVKINLLDSGQTVQFTARSPAVSCKYIVWTETGTFIRRFQVSLSRDEDFEKLQIVISRLRLKVKPARISPFSASNQIGTSGSRVEQATVPKNPPSTIEPRALAVDPSLENVLANSSLIENQFLTTPMEQICQYPLYSQVVPDTPWQSQSGAFDEHASHPQPSKVQNSLQAILPKTTILSSDGTTPVGLSPAIPLRSRLRKEISSATVLQGISTKLDEKSTKKKTHSSSRPNEEAKNDDNCVVSMDLLAKAEARLNENVMVASAETYDQCSDQQEKTMEPNEVQELHKDYLTLGNQSEKNVLESKCDIPYLDGFSKKDSKADCTNIGKQRDTKIENRPCDQSLENQSTAKCSKIRITKKMIKEKLKDEYFMKWVSKVEETLSAMTDLQ